VRDYAWIEEEPVGTVDTGPQPTKFAWVHTDRLGTPLAVTSSPATGNAATIWRASYAPFGLATVNEDPDGDLQAYAMNLRFPGQRRDAESGGHYNFFRTYEPQLGRYQEFDPIGLAGGINPYVYANNDSLSQKDPSGQVAAAPPIPIPPLPGPAVAVGIAAAGGALVGLGINHVAGHKIQDALDWLVRRVRPGKWYCTASCNVTGITREPPVPRVQGGGYGSTEDEACRNAKRSATQSTPAGCYPRHCRCTCARL
jgi:RHS repeat-associated protein